EFSLAGALSSVSPLGRWWAAVPADRRPTHAEALAELARHWCEPWGDRRTEIVFIGAAMDEGAIRAALDAALVEGGRFAPRDWAGLADPFPLWGQRKAA
ncbi:MAG: hypothetical protein RIR62_1849, partial [Pseudomonadota bacterium]